MLTVLSFPSSLNEIYLLVCGEISVVYQHTSLWILLWNANWCSRNLQATLRIVLLWCLQ